VEWVIACIGCTELRGRPKGEAKTVSPGRSKPTCLCELGRIDLAFLAKLDSTAKARRTKTTSSTDFVLESVDNRDF
jgi:hypothetical protein